MNHSQRVYADNKGLNTELLPCGQTFYSHKSRVKKFILEYQPEGDPEDWQSFYLHTGKYKWSMQVSTYCEHRQKLSAAKFLKKCGATLSLNCLMGGKCAANLANSAARVQRIFAKCAEKVRRIYTVTS